MAEIIEIKIPEIHFDSNGELIINPTSTSSMNDFDFFVGKWNLRNKKLASRLNNCTEWTEFQSTQEMYKILNGPFEGMSLRLFDPLTKLWSIYWADSNTGKMDPPVQGSFENKIGHFITKDIFEGRPILVAFRWDARDENNLIWSQAFSDDNGETWEWNWYMYMSKFVEV